MNSKALLFLSLIVVSLIASEVVARDIAENSADHKNNEGEEVKQTEQYGGYPGGGYGNRGGGYGNRGGGYGNRGGYGRYPGRGGGYGGRGRGYCPYGCCYRGYYGGCSRCCAYAGQAVQTQAVSSKPGH